MINTTGHSSALVANASVLFSIHVAAMELGLGRQSCALHEEHRLEAGRGLGRARLRVDRDRVLRERPQDLHVGEPADLAFALCNLRGGHGGWRRAAVWTRR